MFEFKISLIEKIASKSFVPISEEKTLNYPHM